MTDYSKHPLCALASRHPDIPKGGYAWQFVVGYLMRADGCRKGDRPLHHSWPAGAARAWDEGWVARWHDERRLREVIRGRRVFYHYDYWKNGRKFHDGPSCFGMTWDDFFPSDGTRPYHIRGWCRSENLDHFDLRRHRFCKRCCGELVEELQRVGIDVDREGD